MYTNEFISHRNVIIEWVEQWAESRTHLSKCEFGSNWNENGLFRVLEKGNHPCTFNNPVLVIVTCYIREVMCEDHMTVT